MLPPLGFVDTVKLQAQFLTRGFGDASKGRAVFETLATNKQVQGVFVKSSLLQGVLLISAIVIKPILNKIQEHAPTQSLSRWSFILFHLFWLYPLALAATYYSGLLRTPKARGRSSGAPFRGLTSTAITESYRVLILANYFAGLFALRLIPYVGPIVSFFYACIFDSYYCFEAHWEKSGHGLSERVKNLETRWAYHLGFGFPITLICVWSNDPVVNLSLFSLFFPLAQIMSATSIPQPLDPDLPTSSMSLSFLPQSSGSSFSMAAAEGGEEARGRTASPYFPKRIRLLFLADVAYSFLVKNFVPTNAKKDASGGGYSYQQHQQQQQQQQQAYGHDGGWRGGEQRGGAGGVPNRYQPTAVPPPPASEYYSKRQEGGEYSTPPPPRRGHVASESSIGVASAVPLAGVGRVGAGPERGVADRQLDSLISEAARRRKGD